MDKPATVIKFFAPVNEATINALMDAVDQRMRQRVGEFIVLISSGGGSVFHGLSAYNYLNGIPAAICTHNFGKRGLHRRGSLLCGQHPILCPAGSLPSPAGNRH